MAVETIHSKLLLKQSSTGPEKSKAEPPIQSSPEPSTSKANLGKSTNTTTQSKPDSTVTTNKTKHKYKKKKKKVKDNQLKTAKSKQPNQDKPPPKSSDSQPCDMPKTFKESDIHSIVSSKRANGKIYYKVKWNDRDRGNTWEYGSSIPESLRREYHLKRNMSGTRRKRPLKHHKFFDQREPKQREPSVNVTSPQNFQSLPSNSCTEPDVTSYPSYPKHLRTVCSFPIRQIMGIKIVQGDCYVTIIPECPVPEPMDLYFECIPTHLIQQYLTESWNDLYSWTEGERPQDYSPYDYNIGPIYASRRHQQMNSFDYQEVSIDPCKDRPYQYVLPVYTCPRQINIFLHKVQILLNKRLTSL